MSLHYFPAKVQFASQPKSDVYLFFPSAVGMFHLDLKEDVEIPAQHREAPLWQDATSTVCVSLTSAIKRLEQNKSFLVLRALFLPFTAT